MCRYIYIYNLLYIISIVFFRTLILTFYTLRSVRRKSFKEYIVKFLQYSKPFSSSVPQNCSQVLIYVFLQGISLQIIAAN